MERTVCFERGSNFTIQRGISEVKFPSFSSKISCQNKRSLRGLFQETIAGCVDDVSMLDVP